MATKKELFAEVERLNKKYCSKTKNKLRVSQAYGGYEVQLTGKRYKNNPKKWRGIGSGCVEITHGHNTATKTLEDLYRYDSKGYVKNNIRYYEKKR